MRRTILQSPEYKEWYRTRLTDEERDAIVATAIRLVQDAHPDRRRDLRATPGRRGSQPIARAAGRRAQAMTEGFDNFQGEINAALADPIRRARVDQFGRQIDLILALSAIREAVGMTQEDFASAAMMSQENVSRIERATDVKLSTIQRLARTAGAQLELNAVMPSGERVALLRPAKPAATR
jgi:DNA-binding XRE family transcriptional regulator